MYFSIWRLWSRFCSLFKSNPVWTSKNIMEQRTTLFQSSFELGIHSIHIFLLKAQNPESNFMSGHITTWMPIIKSRSKLWFWKKSKQYDTEKERKPGEWEICCCIWLIFLIKCFSISVTVSQWDVDSFKRWESTHLVLLLSAMLPFYFDNWKDWKIRFIPYYHNLGRREFNILYLPVLGALGVEINLICKLWN